jgi:hypothetical protein
LYIYYAKKSQFKLPEVRAAVYSFDPDPDGLSLRYGSVEARTFGSSFQEVV